MINKIDILDKDDKYRVEAELPGLDKSEIKVTLQGMSTKLKAIYV